MMICSLDETGVNFIFAANPQVSDLNVTAGCTEIAIRNCSLRFSCE